MTGTASEAYASSAAAPPPASPAVVRTAVSLDRPASIIDLDRPRAVPEILRDALDLYRRFPALFLGLAVGIVAVSALGIIGVWGGELWSGFDPEHPAAPWATYQLAQTIVVSPLIAAIHARAVMRLGAGERPATGTVLNEGLEALPRLLVVVIMAAVLTLLGLLLFVVPGIWIGVLMTVVGCACVVEDLGGPDALRRSRDLVTDNWWRTFGLLLLTILITFAVAAVAGIVVQGIADALDSGALGLLAIIVVDTITLTFGALVTTLLYFDLRHRAQHRPL